MENILFSINSWNITMNKADKVPYLYGVPLKWPVMISTSLCSSACAKLFPCMLAGCSDLFLRDMAKVSLQKLVYTHTGLPSWNSLSLFCLCSFEESQLPRCEFFMGRGTWQGRPVANCQPRTGAFRPTAHKEPSPAKNHINELRNVFFLEQTVG